jgi:hypothetical protein
MQVGKDGLSGCSRVTLKVLAIKTLKFEIGCFKIPFAEDEVVAGVVSGTKQDLHVHSLQGMRTVISSRTCHLDNYIKF